MLSGFLQTGMFVGTNLSNISTLFSMPNIGQLYDESDGKKWYEAGGNAIYGAIFKSLVNILKLGFPVYTDTYEESLQNNIGEQVLIENTGEKAGILTKVADNIVPQARIWKIHGYMGFQPIQAIPLASDKVYGTLIGLVDKIGKPVLNSLIKDYVRYVANSRRPFKFCTTEGEVIPSLIKDYRFVDKVENSNYIEVNLEIQEFRWIGLSNADGQYNGGEYNYSFSKTATLLGRTVAKSILL